MESVNLFSYWTHVLFGVFAFGAGIYALCVTKGSPRHVVAGRIFAAGMIVAALTSLVFGLERPLPLLFVQAAAVLYLVPSSILALRHRRTYAKPLNGLLLLIPMTIAGFATLRAMRMARADVLLPAVGPSLIAVVFGGLAVQDIRWMTVPRSAGNIPVRRHLARMILAFAFASMAVLREAVPFGLPFQVTTILPLVVAIPLILYHDLRLRDVRTADGTDDRSWAPEV